MEHQSEKTATDYNTIVNETCDRTNANLQKILTILLNLRSDEPDTDLKDLVIAITSAMTHKSNTSIRFGWWLAVTQYVTPTSSKRLKEAYKTLVKQANNMNNLLNQQYYSYMISKRLSAKWDTEDSQSSPLLSKSEERKKRPLAPVDAETRKDTQKKFKGIIKFMQKREKRPCWLLILC